jgi:hypothetical protein
MITISTTDYNYSLDIDKSNIKYNVPYEIKLDKPKLEICDFTYFSNYYCLLINSIIMISTITIIDSSEIDFKTANEVLNDCCQECLRQIKENSLFYKHKLKYTYTNKFDISILESLFHEEKENYKYNHYVIKLEEYSIDDKLNIFNYFGDDIQKENIRMCIIKIKKTNTGGLFYFEHAMKKY